uniref:Uncharacterized protein n=1 Tax=Meloidogyne enterolobii TaxID=390850 RepID=A0A6V7V6R4_MELEN|nr:unnamed protein product [Meloidogyne enterolobii]
MLLDMDILHKDAELAESGSVDVVIVAVVIVDVVGFCYVRDLYVFVLTRITTR